MTNEELAERIKAGTVELYEDLWKQVQWLITAKVNSFCTRNQDLCLRRGITGDDLMQAGFLALVDAVQAYDPQAGYSFTTYLKFPLRNQIRATLDGGRIRRTFDAAWMGIESLNSPITVSDGDDLDLREVVPDPDSQKGHEQVDEDIFLTQMHQTLEREMSISCTETQRDVLCAHYFEQRTLAQIAKDFGCSAENVRRIESQGIEQLRKKSIRQLFPFMYPDAGEFAWQGNGLSAFKHNGVSGVEKAVEKAEEKRQHFIQQLESQSEERRQTLAGLSKEETVEYYRKRLQQLRV